MFVCKGKFKLNLELNLNFGYFIYTYDMINLGFYALFLAHFYAFC